MTLKHAHVQNYVFRRWQASPDLHRESFVAIAGVTCSAWAGSGAECDSPGAGHIWPRDGVPEGRQGILAGILLPL